MNSRKATEAKIMKLEKKHPDILFLDSEANGLYYATHAQDDRIALISTGGVILLNREQMYALCREGMDVFNYYHSRGKVARKAAINETREKMKHEQLSYND